MGQKHILMYCARHGTTILNQTNCFRGPLDVPLDKKGIQDAHQLAYYFSPIELSGIAYSPKKRAAKTVDIISGNRKDDFKPHPNKNLQAWNVGDLGGKEKTPENDAIIEYHVQNPDIPLKGGESLNDFRSRIRPLIGDGIEHAIKTGSPVLLVVHSSVIHELGEMLHGSHAATLVKPGGVAAVYIQDGKLSAEPIFKPDFAAMKRSRSDIVT